MKSHDITLHMSNLILWTQQSVLWIQREESIGMFWTIESNIQEAEKHKPEWSKKVEIAARARDYGL